MLVTYPLKNRPNVSFHPVELDAYVGSDLPTTPPTGSRRPGVAYLRVWTSNPLEISLIFSIQWPVSWHFECVNWDVFFFGNPPSPISGQTQSTQSTHQLDVLSGPRATNPIPPCTFAPPRNHGLRGDLHIFGTIRIIRGCSMLGRWDKINLPRMINDDSEGRYSRPPTPRWSSRDSYSQPSTAMLFWPKATDIGNCDTWPGAWKSWS